NLAAESYPLVVQEVAEQLVGEPYAEGLLDQGEEENLVADLTAFDCVTYVENVLSVAQTIKSEDYGYDTYARTLQDYRYRGGEMDGYCSRLHYFTDWIHNNAERGNVEDITRELGGVPFEKEIDFMGTHRDSYPRLASDETYQCILEVEEALRDRDLYYVPQDRIDAIEDQLRPGDIVATATDLDGLDVTHTGFVYKHADGRTGFIHASLSGEVKVSPDLSEYVQGVERQIGIIVARPLERSLNPLPDGASGRVEGQP
ncbi:MAG: DUF1460 domain-containing protein, partial [Rhodothermales bacterium]|nr:DUF1460 domain-containing protein [Rhodothermales bacterium]